MGAAEPAGSLERFRAEVCDEWLVVEAALPDAERAAVLRECNQHGAKSMLRGGMPRGGEQRACGDGGSVYSAAGAEQPALSADD